MSMTHENAGGRGTAALADPFPWRVGVNESGPRFATERDARNRWRDWWNKPHYAPRHGYAEHGCGASCLDKH